MMTVRYGVKDYGEGVPLPRKGKENRQLWMYWQRGWGTGMINANWEEDGKLR